jgi:hypothetical protein
VEIKTHTSGLVGSKSKVETFETYDIFKSGRRRKLRTDTGLEELKGGARVEVTSWKSKVQKGRHQVIWQRVIESLDVR